MTSYLSRKLWDEIFKQSNLADVQIVASPYIGNDISGLIHFEENDILICSLNESNVKTGIVSPFTLERLFKKGVIIYSHQKLHSKIYYFENSIIIGSANLSSHSSEELHESGIITNDKKTIKSVKQELDSIIKTSDHISLDHIESLKKLYNDNKKKKSKRRSSKSDFWIISTTYSDFTKKEIEKLKETEDDYNNDLKSNRYELVDIKFSIDDKFINEVQIGEKVIEVYKEEGQRYYYMSEPMTILGTEKGPVEKSKIRTRFLRLEKRKSANKFFLKDVKNKLSTFKLNVSKKEIRIVSDKTKKELLRVLKELNKK